MDKGEIEVQSTEILFFIGYIQQTPALDASNFLLTLRAYAITSRYTSRNKNNIFHGSYCPRINL